MGALLGRFDDAAGALLGGGAVKAAWPARCVITEQRCKSPDLDSGGLGFLEALNCPVPDGAAV